MFKGLFKGAEQYFKEKMGKEYEGALLLNLEVTVNYMSTVMLNISKIKSPTLSK